MGNRGYMAIPPGAIIPGALPKFKIYIRSPQGRYILWALEGKSVREEQLAKISEGGLAEVFVDIDECLQYEQYLETHLGNILENPWASDDQKATIFSKVSTNVVRNAFESSLSLGSMGEETMKRTRRMVNNALQFISESKSLQALSKMIGHDYQTYEHAAKVLWFTMSFLGDNPEIMKQIDPAYPAFDDRRRIGMLSECGVGALLHDIGKALIPPEILNSNTVLSDVEREIMKRHPLNSLAMLLDTDIPVFVKKAVLHHHEDFQGGGYPLGLLGPDIPVLARVLRIIDAFEAMTSRRPYKDPMPPRVAMQIMIGEPVNQDDGNGDQDSRDNGMRRCFDEELLRKFILFLGNVNLNR